MTGNSECDKARRRAAELLRMFRVGQFDSGQLTDLWPPAGSCDPVVEFFHAVFCDCDEMHLNPDADDEWVHVNRRLIERCVLLLESGRQEFSQSPAEECFPFATQADLEQVKRELGLKFSTTPESLHRESAEWLGRKRRDAVKLVDAYLAGTLSAEGLQQDWLLAGRDWSMDQVARQHMSRLPAGLLNLVKPQRQERIRKVMGRLRLFLSADDLCSWHDFSKPWDVRLACLGGLAICAATFSVAFLFSGWLWIPVVWVVSIAVSLVTLQSLQRLLFAGMLHLGRRRYWPFRNRRKYRQALEGGNY